MTMPLLQLPPPPHATLFVFVFKNCRQVEKANRLLAPKHLHSQEELMVPVALPLLLGFPSKTHREAKVTDSTDMVSTEGHRASWQSC